MVGEAAGRSDRDAGVGQRREELLRIADAGKSQDAAAADRGNKAGIGPQLGRKDRNIPHSRGRDDIRSPRGRPHHDQRMRPHKLRLKRRAQRSGGNDPAIADAALPIDHQHRKILGERRILEAVIHDDDAAADARR